MGDTLKIGRRYWTQHPAVATFLALAGVITVLGFGFVIRGLVDDDSDNRGLATSSDQQGADGSSSGEVPEPSGTSTDNNERSDGSTSLVPEPEDGTAAFVYDNFGLDLAIGEATANAHFSAGPFDHVVALNLDDDPQDEILFIDDGFN